MVEVWQVRPPFRCLATPSVSPTHEPLARGATVDRVRTLVVAHQGGWDEILLVVGPLVLLFLVLMLANRRAKRLGDRDDSTTKR